MTTSRSLRSSQRSRQTKGSDPAWRKALIHAGLVYLFSRLCVFVGAAVVAAELRADATKLAADGPANAPWADPHYADKVIGKSAVGPVLDVLTAWDGAWYMSIVNKGYPRVIQPNVTFEVLDARAAFFPAYPMLVRTLNHVIPGGAVTAGLLVNFVLGAVAVLLTGLIARRLYSTEVAQKTMIVFAMFPGSLVLSLTYTEALLITVAAGCLLCLMDERWLWAGVLAAIGTAARPNGIALIGACVVASFIAIRHRRDWWSLICVALAPLGFIGFQLFLTHQTGESGVWFRVQSEAWKEGTSFGMTAIRNTVEAFTHPLTSPTDTITAASMVVLGFLIYAAWRYRLPWPIVAYCAGIVFLMLAPSTVTARPRFLLTAFPLFISAAAYLQHHRRELWPYVIGASAAGLVGLTGLYGVLGAIP